MAINEFKPFAATADANVQDVGIMPTLRFVFTNGAIQ